MTYPTPPELLEQLLLEPRADTDPQWPEDHDANGRTRYLANEDHEPDDRDRFTEMELSNGG